MTEYRFTKEQALEALRKAVKLKGEDYVYPEEEKFMSSCRYATDEGKPSCIVGHVVNILDPEAFAHLAAVEAEQGTTAAEDLTHSGYDDSYLPVDFWDRDTARVLGIAQAQQDIGSKWGDALGTAEDAV